MSVFDRIGKWVYRKEIAEAERIADVLLDALQMIPYTEAQGTNTINTLAELTSMSEIDSEYIDLFLRQIRNRSRTPELSEQVRLSVIDEARSLYTWDVITQNVVDLWTDYGFGAIIDIAPDDPTAVPVWEEYWKANRNSQILGDRDVFNLSTTLLNDGEFFFTYFISTMDGKVTVRIVDSKEITKRVTDPDDSYKVLYYERTFTTPDNEQRTIYYKDWQASDKELSRAKLPEDAVLAHDSQSVDDVGDSIESTTDVLMMHVSHRERNGRGWPLMTAGISWSRAYRDFLQDRAAIARAVAMFVDKMEVKGTNRTVDAIKAKLESSLTSGSGYVERNPSAAAGSVWVENEGSNRSRMPLNTGAGDAEKDGAPLLAQAGLAGRIFPHYLGRGEAFRLATATSMEQPVMRAFTRYKLFWSSVWRDMVKIVLMAAEEYGSDQFITYDAAVNTDAILRHNIKDLIQLAGTVEDLTAVGLLDMVEAQIVSRKLVQTGLQAVGIPDSTQILPDEITSSESFAEAAVTNIDRYRSALRTAVYGLWSGNMDRLTFIETMESAIDRNLRIAWYSVLSEYNLKPSDMSPDEELALGKAILEEYGYIAGFGDFIDANSKANDGLLRDSTARMEKWVNRFRDIVNRARVLVAENEPLEWVYGGTVEHCRTCGSLVGKVKRADYWKDFYARTGIRPQSQKLSCKGYGCECDIVPTAKPLSKGPLPVKL